MSSNRPFRELDITMLQAVVDTATTRETLRYVQLELSYRSTRAAKKLLDKVRSRLQELGDGAPDQLFESPSSKPANRTSPSPPPSTTVSKKPKFKPTDEQIAAVDAFKRGASLKVSAFAGAGKTSTLNLMADANAGRGLYLAFNKKIAQEARSTFPGNVSCMTTHSLAVGAVRKRFNYTSDKLFGTMGNKQLAEILKLEPRLSFGEFALTRVQQAHYFRTTVRQFCLSGAPEITVDHVPHLGLLEYLPDAVTQYFDEWVVGKANDLWDRMRSADDPIPLGHDGYLKLWSLMSPQLAYDYILLDEAQDTNPAVLSVMAKQATQMVYVGDRHQQIYAWRGAVNAMEKIDTREECYLTQSFRFGSRIAREASRIIARLGEYRSVRGNPSIDSVIEYRGYSDAILTRKNATVFHETLRAIENGRRPFIVGGTQDLQFMVKDVLALMRGTPGSHPEFFGFQNWQEVVDFSGTKEGVELRPFVSLVERVGPDEMLRAINQSAPSPSAANVSISTIHKAKGLEWKSVRIADDFSKDRDGKRYINRDELRLFYVGITRARQRLLIDDDLLADFTAASDVAESAAAPTPSSPTRQGPAPSSDDGGTAPLVDAPGETNANRPHPAYADAVGPDEPIAAPAKRKWRLFGRR